MRVANAKLAARNMSRRMNPMLQIERVRRQTMRPQNPIGPERVMTQASEDATIIE